MASRAHSTAGTGGVRGAQTISVKGTTSASPLMYQVNGRQFLAVVSSDTVQAYGLP